MGLLYDHGVDTDIRQVLPEARNVVLEDQNAVEVAYPYPDCEQRENNGP